MNPLAGWRKIIGTPERAKKLLNVLGQIPEARRETVIVDDDHGMPVAYLTQRVPPYCPTVVLFGQRRSARLYKDPELRPALDAWDTGEVDKPALKRICLDILGIQWWKNGKASR